MIYVVAVIVIVLVLWIIGAYNSLVRGRVRTQESWSDIDVQLKRRHDLIPNLVETVKAYAKHEKGVFEGVSEARAAALGATGIEDKSKAENQLTQTLKSVFAVAEAYPELKASDNFKELQGELSDTENKISAARRFYNGNVRDYNISLGVFPTSIFAKMFGFEAMQLFQLDDEGERSVPQVSFSDSSEGEVKEEK